jgi:hypothetical protein
MWLSANEGDRPAGTVFLRIPDCPVADRRGCRSHCPAARKQSTQIVAILYRLRRIYGGAGWMFPGQMDIEDRILPGPSAAPSSIAGCDCRYLFRGDGLGQNCDHVPGQACRDFAAEGLPVP